MDIVTLLGDWPTGPGPLHRRLAAALARLVDAGKLRSGTRLPSERALAKRLVLSRSTVVAAYRLLAAAGVVESRHGSGTYVAGSSRRLPPVDIDAPTKATPIFSRLLADAGPADADEPVVISFASAAVPPCTGLADAVRAAAHEDLAALTAMSGYQPLGILSLREAVAAVLTDDGLPTTADQLVTTTGAHQALHLCAAVLARPGDWIAVEDPAYPGCIDAFAAVAARLAPVEVDADGMIPESLEGVLADRAVSVICVTPTFHNPTGAELSHYRRRRIVEVAARYGVPVVEDNTLAYTRLSDEPPPPPFAAYGEEAGVPVITIGSTSKMLWSGLRVGWVRAPEPWLGRLSRRKVASDLGSAVFDQAVAARLLADLPRVVADLRVELHRRLARCEDGLRERFDEWSWRQPTGGASLWVRLPADAARFAQVALRHGVEVIPGTVFSPGSRWDDHIRLPFALDPVVLDEALDRLRAAWSAYRPDDPVTRRFDDPALVV